MRTEIIKEKGDGVEISSGELNEKTVDVISDTASLIEGNLPEEVIDEELNKRIIVAKKYLSKLNINIPDWYIIDRIDTIESHMSKNAANEIEKGYDKYIKRYEHEKIYLQKLIFGLELLISESKTVKKQDFNIPEIPKLGGNFDTLQTDFFYVYTSLIHNIKSLLSEKGFTIEDIDKYIESLDIKKYSVDFPGMVKIDSLRTKEEQERWIKAQSEYYDELKKEILGDKSNSGFNIPNKPEISDFFLLTMQRFIETNSKLREMTKKYRDF